MDRPATSQHSTIAYTGINLPYPLTGDAADQSRASTSTSTATCAGASTTTIAPTARGRFDPLPPLLAISSGELDAGQPPRDRATMRCGRATTAWRAFETPGSATFARLGVDTSFVAALSAYEIDYVWHNDQAAFRSRTSGPAADPRSFRSMYENPEVQIYAVATP